MITEDTSQCGVNALGKLREGPGPQGGLFHNFFSPADGWHFNSSLEGIGETTSKFWAAQLVDPY